MGEEVNWQRRFLEQQQLWEALETTLRNSCDEERSRAENLEVEIRDLQASRKGTAAMNTRLSQKLATAQRALQLDQEALREMRTEVRFGGKVVEKSPSPGLTLARPPVPLPPLVWNRRPSGETSSV